MTYKVAKVIVTGAEARAVDKQTITRGLTGAVVEFEYRDPMWDGLKKCVVFEGYSEPVGFLAGTNLVVLPWEVTTQIGALVKVGVYGEDATGSLVIPTIWAELGNVKSAPDGKFNPPGAPSPSIWGQILSMIGDLDDLETEARNNLVAAINEAMKTGSDSIGGYYTPMVSSPEAGVMRVAFVPSEDGMEQIASVDIPIPAGKDGEPGAPGASGVYTLAEGETLEDVPADADVVIDPYGEPEEEPEENTGTDISLGITKAEVGMLARVSAVDENGVPTSWEPVEMPDTVPPDFRLIASFEDITVPEGQERFDVNISQDIEGNVLREEEIVLEISASTHVWSYFGVSINTPEGKVNLGSVDDTRNIKLVHIKRVGMRYVAECYGYNAINSSSATHRLSAVFAPGFEPVNASCITGINLGPFTNLSMKAYAKSTLKPEVV